MMTPVHELTDRARDVFRVVVESYLGSGAPVGSRTISKLGAMNLSPASIRNVMQEQYPEMTVYQCEGGKLRRYPDYWGAV